MIMLPTLIDTDNLFQEAITTFLNDLVQLMSAIYLYRYKNNIK
jgi:hypothetical protein